MHPPSYLTDLILSYCTVYQLNNPSFSHPFPAQPPISLLTYPSFSLRHPSLSVATLLSAQPPSLLLSHSHLYLGKVLHFSTLSSISLSGHPTASAQPPISLTDKYCRAGTGTGITPTWVIRSVSAVKEPLSGEWLWWESTSVVAADRRVRGWLSLVPGREKGPEMSCSRCLCPPVLHHFTIYLQNLFV